MTPPLPLAPSRFDVTVYGKDLIVVANPDLRLAFTLACCACIATSAALLSILEYHTLLVVPAFLATYLLGVQAQAVLRGLSVAQVLRVAPEGWSVAACYPNSAMLRVLAGGMSVDAQVPDVLVKETVVGAKVRIHPTSMASQIT